MAEASLLLSLPEAAAERDAREKLALWDGRADTKAPLTDRQTDSVLALKAAAEALPVPAEVRRRRGPGWVSSVGASADARPADRLPGSLPSFPGAGTAPVGEAAPLSRAVRPLSARDRRRSPCGAGRLAGSFAPGVSPRVSLGSPRPSPAAHPLPEGERGEPEVLRFQDSLLLVFVCHLNDNPGFPFP